MDVDKNIRLSPGLGLVVLLSIIPMFAWKIGFDMTGLSAGEVIFLSLAKIGAFGGMAMFALSLTLSGRYYFFDKLFGGLDKMYVAHRFLGTFSLLLLFLHPLAFTIYSYLGNEPDFLSIWYDPRNYAVFLGTLAFYALLGIGLWSIFAKTKYETFLKVHKLLGFVYLVGATHAFLAGSVLHSNMFMAVYMLTLTVIGGLTFALYSLLGDVLHKKYTYKVLTVKDAGHNITEIAFRPRRRIINFRPGQFIYIQFLSLAEHGFHPFSIASGNKSSKLRLAVRRSGDFTQALNDIQPNEKALVKGPYGGFHVLPNRNQKQVWIAGGIGVTPFLSGAASFRARAKSMNIDMVYASDDERPYGLAEFKTVAKKHDFFSIIQHDSKTHGFLTLKHLEERFPDLQQRQIFICGPPVMLQSLIAEAKAGGFEDCLRYEEFSY